MSDAPESDPDRLPKRTGDEMPTMRAIYASHKWIKPPPNAPPPSATHEGPLQGSVPQMRCEANQKKCNEDYTTSYQSDFPEWKVPKCLPFKQANSFKVEHGLVLNDDRFQKDWVEGDANSKPLPPFERVTSYRSDYVSHPVQSAVRVKPVHNTKGLLAHPAAPPKPKTPSLGVNKDTFDKTKALSPDVNNWFPDNKLQGTGKAPKASPPANPGRASRQAREGARLPPSWGTTTMKEDFKRWKTPPFSFVRKDPDWPKKPTPRPPKPAKRRPSAAKAPPCPAENSHGKAPGTRGSRTCWSGSFDGGGAPANGSIGGGPNESHHTISYMISSSG